MLLRKQLAKPIEGEVVKISLDGTSKNGVTNFVVTVRVKERQELLKGGMNLSADIETKSTTNVLYVPKRSNNDGFRKINSKG